MTPRLYIYRASVVSVYDGDSLRVSLDLGFGITVSGDDGKGIPLRLYGIDAPEISGPTRPAGITARDRLRELLPPGAPTFVETLKDRTGKYGRYLAVVRPHWSEMSVNRILLMEQLAHPALYGEKDATASLALW